jgi:NAD(P)-dependent dehydrogenase (short-subunit alcohol dehydrogenase family)
VARGQEAVAPIDIAIANAGVAGFAREDHDGRWQDIIDVNLTGVLHTFEAVVPGLVERGRGGSIVTLSSVAGLSGIGGMRRADLAYTASKHGVVGLTRVYANRLAKHWIRVNSVHPTGVHTDLTVNPAIEESLLDGSSDSGDMRNALPVEMLQPIDVSHAIAWLTSDQARHVTGIQLPVDAGMLNWR